MVVDIKSIFEVGSDTLHIIGNRPATVVIIAQRSITCTVFAPTAESNGVAAYRVDRKKMFEPIGIGVFAFSHKGSLSCWCIGVVVIAGVGVDGTHALIPLVVNAAAPAVEGVLQIEIAFTVHLLQERHRFLRVQQVEIFIRGNGAEALFVAISNAVRRIAFARFGCNNNHPIEGARSIHRSSRCVFQHLYILYISSVESSNSRAH